MASYDGYTGVRLPWREDCILVSSWGHNNNSVVSSVSLTHRAGQNLIGQMLVFIASDWLEIVSMSCFILA